MTSMSEKSYVDINIDQIDQRKLEARVTVDKQCSY